MKHAIVINNVVVNIVMADEVMGRANGWIPAENVGVGAIYDGERFHLPEPSTNELASEARVKRNALLVKTDVETHVDRWMKMSSEKQQQWSEYRQALRDVPEQEGFPQIIVWPNEPI